MESKSYTYSKILDYATCPRIYFFRNIAKIFPSEKPKPLSLGYCMSNALRAYRSVGTLEAAKQGFKEAWLEDDKVLSIEYDPDDPKDFRTVRRALEILEEYVEKYPDDPKNTIKPEVSFEIDAGKVRGYNITLRGRIDGVMSDGRGGARIIEDKNVSRLGDWFFVVLGGSLQVGLYLYAAEQYGLFDLGEKRTTPSCLMSAIRFHPKEAKFQRDIAIKARQTLHHFKDNALTWIDRIISSEEKNIFPHNDIDNSICTKYGGCEYAPLKYTDGNVRRSLLLKSYKRKEKVDSKYIMSPLTDDDIEGI